MDLAAPCEVQVNLVFFTEQTLSCEHSNVWLCKHRVGRIKR